MTRMLRFVMPLLLVSLTSQACLAQLGSRLFRGGWRQGWLQRQEAAEFGVHARPPVPPWHGHQKAPHARTLAEAQKDDYTLRRMHEFRLREQRYFDDYGERYSSGDPFYHRPGTGWPMRSSAFPQPARQPVPGVTDAHRGGPRHRHVDDADVPELLRAAANRLVTSLSRMHDGETWLDELAPRQIVAAIDHWVHPAELADLLPAYQAVAHSPRLVLVARANGFADTHYLLHRFVRLDWPTDQQEWTGDDHRGLDPTADGTAEPPAPPRLETPHDVVPDDRASDLVPLSSPANEPPSATGEGQGEQPPMQRLPPPRGQPEADPSAEATGSVEPRVAL